jgi:hypothetical protein
MIYDDIFSKSSFKPVSIVIILTNQCTINQGRRLLNCAYWALGKLVRLQFLLWAC